MNYAISAGKVGSEDIRECEGREHGDENNGSLSLVRVQE